jgi:CheY-like chemotaxis protein
MTMPSQPLIILLADDDDGHATLIQRNLRRTGIVNEIVRVEDGQAALDFLRRHGRFAERPANGPVVALLDINMPRVDGVEALRQIKAEKGTAMVPVIMLTTTDDPREIQRCYELGCSVYITKPVAADDFMEAIRRLGLLLAIAKVPTDLLVEAKG